MPKDPVVEIAKVTTSRDFKTADQGTEGFPFVSREDAEREALIALEGYSEEGVLYYAHACALTEGIDKAMGRRRP